MAKRASVPEPSNSAAAPATEGASGQPAPRYRTRVLWGVLSGLYVAGAASAIVGIYALSVAWAGGTALIWLPVGILGIMGGLFCLWLTVGILYRVDRLRGNLTRRVEMFE